MTEHASHLRRTPWNFHLCLSAIRSFLKLDCVQYLSCFKLELTVAEGESSDFSEQFTRCRNDGGFKSCSRHRTVHCAGRPKDVRQYDWKCRICVRTPKWLERQRSKARTVPGLSHKTSCLMLPRYVVRDNLRMLKTMARASNMEMSSLKRHIPCLTCFQRLRRRRDQGTSLNPVSTSHSSVSY